MDIKTAEQIDTEYRVVVPAFSNDYRIEKNASTQDMVDSGWEAFKVRKIHTCKFKFKKVLITWHSITIIHSLIYMLVIAIYVQKVLPLV